ncbi:uncharacterized protein LOC128256890 [Drosophila gunungcola]|uniref:Uncharacterized protein n=1 Tax=Drosophila gunungcola TaxID=103775 RepID=A0A9Q0BL91_9MUSC|nr:uncharacterized protein LOC128256890 [Drosophila gunungcola]KAI8035750.1 hypothetical protein M5D96_011500 [Drosophila gunungcola]
MSRLSVLSGFTRSVFRSSRNHRYLLRCQSDNSDAPFISHPTDQTQSGQKEMEKTRSVEHSSHLFVWPDLKDKNLHKVEEFKDDSDDDITASWGWKNNELDVEQLAGMPSPSHSEDPYMQFEEEQEDDQLLFSEEDLQFERTRSLREHLTQELNSQEPFTSFERSSLNTVRQNVDFMMQELSQISLLLNALYSEKSGSLNNTMGQAENALDTIYPGPEMASWSFNPAQVNENQVNQPNMNENLDKEEVFDQLMGFEITNAAADQFGLDVVETSVITKKPEDIESSVIANEEGEDIASSLETNELESVESSEQANELEGIQGSIITNESDDVGTLDSIITKMGQESAESEGQEYSPTQTTESSPKTDEGQQTEPSETIHTYRPFKTIEVPSSKPTSSLCSELNEEQPFNREAQAVTGFEDNPGYSVAVQLTEPESRLLMRMALKQALNDLESGKNKYKATILESETE